MKQCTKCGVVKQKADFCVRSAVPSGMQPYCKECSRAVNNASHDKTFRTLRGHVSKIAANRKSNAKAQNIPFEVDVEYLMSIVTEVCPALNIPLAWCQRNKKFADNSPSLDKFDPSKGYVKGNVAWISHRANTIKNNATTAEVQAVANWMTSKT